MITFVPATNAMDVSVIGRGRGGRAGEGRDVMEPIGNQWQEGDLTPQSSEIVINIPPASRSPSPSTPTLLHLNGVYPGINALNE